MWRRLYEWWQDNWCVQAYECECGWQVIFSAANLRRNGIDPERMVHNHGEDEGQGRETRRPLFVRG